jgi:hypothetical protein
MFTDMNIEDQKLLIIKYDMSYLNLPMYIWSDESGELIHMSKLPADKIERNLRRIKRDIKRIYIYPEKIQEELITLANKKIEELEIALANKKYYFSFIVL